MDYKDLLNLMYIATCDVWYNPDNADIYAADALSGSEDTWTRFFELVDLNGGTDAFSPYLRENLFPKLMRRELGANVYYDCIAYPDWESTVAELLEGLGDEYPVYLDMLRQSASTLSENPEYLDYVRRRAEKLEELEGMYVC